MVLSFPALLLLSVSARGGPVCLSDGHLVRGGTRAIEGGTVVLVGRFDVYVPDAVRRQPCTPTPDDGPWDFELEDGQGLRGAVAEEGDGWLVTLQDGAVVAVEERRRPLALRGPYRVALFVEGSVYTYRGLGLDVRPHDHWSVSAGVFDVVSWANENKRWRGLMLQGDYLFPAGDHLLGSAAIGMSVRWLDAYGRVYDDMVVLGPGFGYRWAMSPGVVVRTSLHAGFGFEGGELNGVLPEPVVGIGLAL